jgi:hypothetical protein
MPGVMLSNSFNGNGLRLLAAGLVSVAAAACSRSPSTKVVPVDGYCGQRAGVAILRGDAPRRPSTSTGALVVRVSAADSGLTQPEGPVRLVRANAKGAQPQSLSLSGQVVRTGQLPAGRYVLEATGTGYQPRRFVVAVRPGATDTVRFRLAAACVRRASR